jgi:hypothetical protein
MTTYLHRFGRPVSLQVGKERKLFGFASEMPNGAKIKVPRLREVQ